MKWIKNHFKYTVHNIIGHPLSEITHLLGLARISDWIHEKSFPRGENSERDHEKLIAEFLRTSSIEYEKEFGDDDSYVRAALNLANQLHL